ncbi:MAG: alanine racemase [Bacillota bacterium]
MIREETVTKIEINLDSLVHNYRQVREHVAPAEVVAVVKSEAYGHGAVPVARALQDEGCRRFAVALVDEGIQLRRGGIRGDILIMGATLANQFRTMAGFRLTPVLADLERVRAWAQLAGERRERLPYHIKVDVGLGRMGLMPERGEEAARIARRLDRQIELIGIGSHLSYPSGPEELNWSEYRRFTSFCAPFDSFAGLRRHLAASQAAARFRQMHLELVRIGGLLYGINHITPSPLDLRPVMSFSTRVAQVKTLPPGWHIGYNGQHPVTEPTRVALLPLGWTDGLTSHHIGSTGLLLRGRSCPLVGTCTDFSMLDVSGVPDTEVGDEVVLIGSQGDLTLTAIDLGRGAGISTGQLLGKISLRVPRLYVSEGRNRGELSILDRDWCSQGQE